MEWSQQEERVGVLFPSVPVSSPLPSHRHHPMSPSQPSEGIHHTQRRDYVFEHHIPYPKPEPWAQVRHMPLLHLHEELRLFPSVPVAHRTEEPWRRDSALHDMQPSPSYVCLLILL